MVFVLLEQSFATVLAQYWWFVSINLVCENKGGFVDTHVSINQIHTMQRVRVRNQSHSRLWGSVVVKAKK